MFESLSVIKAVGTEVIDLYEYMCTISNHLHDEHPCVGKSGCLSSAKADMNVRVTLFTICMMNIPVWVGLSATISVRTQKTDTNVCKAFLLVFPSLCKTN